MRTRALPSIPALGVLLALASHPAGAAASDTLYDRLGGRTGIDRIAAAMVRNCRADPRIASIFDIVEPGHLTRRLGEYICVVSDGPCTYRGHSMAASHHGLDIDQADFNAVVENLEAAMSAAGTPFGTQNALLARLAPLQRAIVSR